MTLETSEGYVLVDRDGQTSVPGIYAGGDCAREVRLSEGVSAARQGPDTEDIFITWHHSWILQRGQEPDVGPNMKKLAERLASDIKKSKEEGNELIGGHFTFGPEAKESGEEKMAEECLAFIDAPSEPFDCSRL